VTQALDVARRPEVQVRDRIGAEGPQLREALACLERPAGGATSPALGEDLNYTGRGFRPVQRARRRPFDDLDALDVGRIDVIQGTCLIVGTPKAVRVIERGPVAPVPSRPPALRKARTLSMIEGAEIFR